MQQINNGDSFAEDKTVTKSRMLEACFAKGRIRSWKQGDLKQRGEHK